MKITLNRILEKSPCPSGWRTLLKSLNKGTADDEPLDLMYILESNGIEDAAWCLCALDYKDYCLFIADVAESVLHLFEENYPKDTRPREVINAIHKYYDGSITQQQLKDFADASAAAAYADAAHAAAYAPYAASAASNAATLDITDAAYAVSVYAVSVYAASAYAAYAYAYAAAARAHQWEEIEELFIKHFGG